MTLVGGGVTVSVLWYDAGWVRCHCERAVSVLYVATSRNLELTQGWGRTAKNKTLVALGFGYRLLECLSTA